MSKTTIGEFSVLSPSQKKELERKHQEQEARKAAMAAKRAKAARKEREAAAAEREKKRREKELKKIWLRIWIGVLCILIIVVLWAWIHFTPLLFSEQEDMFIFFMLALSGGFVVLPVIFVLISGISMLKDILNEIK